MLRLPPLLDTSHIPCYLFWKDIEGRFLGCNEEFAHVAGVKSPQEIIDKTDYDCPWAYTEATQYRKDDLQVMSTGQKKLSFQETQTRSSNIFAHVLTSKMPLMNENNKIIGILGFAQDILVSNDIDQIKLTYSSILSDASFCKTKQELISIIKKIVQVEALILVEIECLSLWVVGYSAKESAKILHVPDKTIHDIRNRIRLICDQNIFEYINDHKTYNLFLLFARLTISASQIRFKNKDRLLIKKELFNLSQREYECLQYIAKGKTTKAIAAMMQLSTRTIENYIDNLKRKLGVNYKSQLLEKIIE